MANGRRIGQIKPRGEARWLVSVYLNRDAAGKKLYRSKIVHGGIRTAEKKLRELIEQKDGGRLARPDHRTLGEYLDWWITNVAAVRVRASTLASYKLIVDTYLKPELGAVRLDRLLPDHVQELVRKLTERGLAARTVRYAIALLNGALRKACKDRTLSRNPLEDVELPRQPRRELQVPGGAARARLLAELQADALWPFWCVMLTTGLRPGEALGLAVGGPRRTRPAR